MSNYNVRPIRLDLKPSTLLAMILISAAVGACVVALAMPIPAYVQIGLVVAVIIATAYHAMDSLLLFPWSIVCVELSSKGELKTIRKDARQEIIHILPGSFVMPAMTILNIRTGSFFRRKNVLITRDRVDGDEFRRLRVWLRWSPQAISGEASAEEA